MNLRASLRPAITLLIIFTALLGLLYPLATTGLAQLVFEDRADGSLVESGGQIIGSPLIGQSFIDPDTNRVITGYFRGRPSASNYDAMASGGSNLAPTSQELIDRVSLLTTIIREENGLDAAVAIPVDLVTASGSGLDPEISPAAAAIQIARVAGERGITTAQALALVEEATAKPTLGFLGTERVNVFTLNRLLDEQYPLPA
jgi:K+-transporting ATPase ATPase C chain